MQTEFRGYIIAVATKENNGHWAAEVWICPGALTDRGAIEGCASQVEAQEAGRRWGEIRIDEWIATGKTTFRLVSSKRDEVEIQGL